MSKTDWVSLLCFQEAKRLNDAQYQHIVYNEYIPILLGEKFVKAFKLSPDR